MENKTLLNDVKNDSAGIYAKIAEDLAPFFRPLQSTDLAGAVTAANPAERLELYMEHACSMRLQHTLGPGKMVVHPLSNPDGVGMASR